MVYELSYLPIAIKDIEGIALYISDTLKAPKAAADFINILDHSIMRLQKFPYSCRIYSTIRPLEYEYRLLPVNNYIVFYTVLEEEKIVEIRRVLYSKMNLMKIV